MARRALRLCTLAAVVLLVACLKDGARADKSGKEDKSVDQKTAESAVELALRAALSVGKKAAVKSRQEVEAETLIDRVGGNKQQSKDEAVKLLASALSKVEGDSGIPVLDLSEKTERPEPSVRDKESSVEKMVGEVADLAKEALKSRQGNMGLYGPRGGYPPYMYPPPAQSPQVIPIPYPMQMPMPNSMGPGYMQMGGLQMVGGPQVDQSYLRGMEEKIESDMSKKLSERLQTPKKMTWEDLDREEQEKDRPEESDAGFVPISFHDIEKKDGKKSVEYKAEPVSPQKGKPPRDHAVDTDGATAEEQVDSLLGTGAE